jgi:hypothetical protein
LKLPETQLAAVTQFGRLSDKSEARRRAAIEQAEREEAMADCLTDRCLRHCDG